MQVFAQDIANKNASAGGSNAHGPSALVDLDKSASFESNGLLYPEAALSNQRMTKFGQGDEATFDGPLMRCSDDFDLDMVGIRAWYRPFMGKNRGTV